MHIQPIVYPSILGGWENGRLPDSVLRPCIGGGRLLIPAAIAWDRMVLAAASDGIALHPSSEFDMYRPYDIQEAIFVRRYTLSWLPGVESRVWSGKRWYKRPGTASAAVPGTSNHGWGLAADIFEVEAAGRLQWLEANAERFGFSWEV